MQERIAAFGGSTPVPALVDLLVSAWSVDAVIVVPASGATVGRERFPRRAHGTCLGQVLPPALVQP